MIAIIDCGIGNLTSVRNAFQFYGAGAKVTQDPADLGEAEKIVLPGVGSFRTAMGKLEKTGMREALLTEVKKKKKPMLGICLGLQLLASKSFEDGETDGLGLVPGEVVRFEGVQLPHTGWNMIEPAQKSGLLEGLRHPYFYFMHSYHLMPADKAVVLAYTDYGTRFASAILKENIFAVQFHPEKSQGDGLRVIRNFITWKP